jgi:hypothetical protein
MCCFCEWARNARLRFRTVTPLRIGYPWTGLVGKTADNAQLRGLVVVIAHSHPGVAHWESVWQ